MRSNHMICPRCGHDFYVDSAYATCDACQCFFYASQSRACRVAAGNITIPGNIIIPGYVDQEEHDEKEL